MADKKKKIKSPLLKKNLISSLWQNSEISGGIGVQDTEYETIPSGEVSWTKGKHTVGAKLAKGYSKVDKQNLPSEIGASYTREGNGSTLSFEGSKSGKNKFFGVFLKKKLGVKKNKLGGHIIGKGHDYIKDLI